MGQTNETDADATLFAPAARAPAKVLERDIAFVRAHPVTDALLALADGLLAVLNEERQIVGVNRQLLDALRAASAESVFGMRLGHVFECVHAGERPNGCGTTEFCGSCGAALAVSAALGAPISQQRKCVITTRAPAGPRELCFELRASQLRSGQRKYVVLFLRDTSEQERLAAIERIFVHDVSSHLVALVGASELLAAEGAGDKALLDTLAAAARHVRGALAVQRAMTTPLARQGPFPLETVYLAPFFDDLVRTFSTHTCATGKSLDRSGLDIVPSIRSDSSLLMRVLGNMLVNAFEATAQGGVVSIGCDRTPSHVVFWVHNDTVMPRELVVRVFQPHFSTKAEAGRGLGTYSMKLIGEKLLGGKVELTSDAPHGTTFRFAHPW